MRKMLPAYLITLTTIAFSFWAFPQLPEQVVTHWGIDGQPNGWSSALFAALFLPGLMLMMSLFFAALPSIDPLKKNYEFHGSVYFLFVNVIVGFMGIMQVLMLGTAMGWPINLNLALLVLMGLLFVFIGNLLPRIRPNWFMGIRTPWTLSSERVWRKTHRVGGYTFTVTGLVFMVVAFIPSGAASKAIILAVVIPMVLWPVIYSYLEWRREKAEGSAGERPLSS